MRKKFITFIVAGLLIISLAACGENQTSDKTENSSEKQSKDLTFADLAKYSFVFCSGAGGWSTDFEIEKDGSFKGAYHDSEMGYGTL